MKINKNFFQKMSLPFDTNNFDYQQLNNEKIKDVSKLFKELEELNNSELTSDQKAILSVKLDNLKNELLLAMKLVKAQGNK